MVNEIHKTTSPLSPYITSENPKIDYPNFLINIMKRTMIQNKSIKAEKYAQKKFGSRYQANQQQQHQQQQQFQQVPANYMPNYGGYGQNFQQGYQMQMPMQNQMFYQNFQNFGFQPQFAPQGQQFQQGAQYQQNFQYQQAQQYQQNPQYQQHQQGQYHQNQQSHQGQYQQKKTANGAAVENKRAVVFNSVEDIKGKKQEFDKLSAEERSVVYKKILEEQLLTMKDLVPEFVKKRRFDAEGKSAQGADGC